MLNGEIKKLGNGLYVPVLKKYLLSTSQMPTKHLNVEFDEAKYLIIDKKKDYQTVVVGRGE